MARQVPVLGISIGSRSMGVAVFRDDVLINWEMRSFAGVWSPRKLRAILAVISRLIADHSPHVIAVVLPAAHHASKGLRAITKAIQGLQVPKDVVVRVCTSQELKKPYAGSKRITNRALHDAALKLYPELFREYQKELRYERPYYAKIFEAVLAARLCYSIRHT